jgi:hypothetical protein
MQTKSAPLSDPVLATARFDRLLLVPDVICHCPTRSRARSWFGNDYGWQVSVNTSTFLTANCCKGFKSVIKATGMVAAALARASTRHD